MSDCAGCCIQNATPGKATLLNAGQRRHGGTPRRRRSVLRAAGADREPELTDAPGTIAA